MRRNLGNVNKNVTSILPLSQIGPSNLGQVLFIPNLITDFLLINAGHQISAVPFHDQIEMWRLLEI